MGYAFQHRQHFDHQHGQRSGSYVMAIIVMIGLGLGVFDLITRLPGDCLLESHHGCILR